MTFALRHRVLQGTKPCAHYPVLIPMFWSLCQVKGILHEYGIDDQWAADRSYGEDISKLNHQ